MTSQHRRALNLQFEKSLELTMRKVSWAHNEKTLPSCNVLKFLFTTPSCATLYIHVKSYMYIFHLTFRVCTLLNPSNDIPRPFPFFHDVKDISLTLLITIELKFHPRLNFKVTFPLSKCM